MEIIYALLKQALGKHFSGLTEIIISNITDAISELKDIDTRLTELRKINNSLSRSELKDLASNSFDIAGKYGKKATDYLLAVQEASRAGYDNAAGIAELSLAAQSASEMTSELANQYIIAADNAYKLGGSVEKLTEILDGSNNISNHNSVNMADLAEGMSVVGEQAASMGVEVNETTAALGTMIETTQLSGSEIAAAFETILLNIRQITDDDACIDTEGLERYKKACEALNVSLKETKNGITTLRAPMDVIKELADAYANLGSHDKRKADLLDSVGGGINADALNAILENYDTYEKMLNEYAQGAGSMAAEAEKAANSWEGSLNRLSNTWTDTVENVADSDAVITMINGFNGLLSVINNITEAIGPLGTIGLGAGLFAGFNNIGKTYKHTVSNHLFNCFEYALHA
ncbi:MAG: phage tail tape measure protein [Lachnospiraceae bacterium]|nr:phage tail tape measure protein [Lachnospiraceae bacterium]